MEQRRWSLRLICIYSSKAPINRLSPEKLRSMPLVPFVLTVDARDTDYQTCHPAALRPDLYTQPATPGWTNWPEPLGDTPGCHPRVSDTYLPTPPWHGGRPLAPTHPPRHPPIAPPRAWRRSHERPCGGHQRKGADKEPSQRTDSIRIPQHRILFSLRLLVLSSRKKPAMPGCLFDSE